MRRESRNSTGEGPHLVFVWLRISTRVWENHQRPGKEAWGGTEADSAWHAHRVCPTGQSGKLPDSQDQVKHSEGSCLTSRELFLDWALLWSHLRNLRSKTKRNKMFPSNVTTFHNKAQDHCVNTKIFSTKWEKFSLYNPIKKFQRHTEKKIRLITRR